MQSNPTFKRLMFPLKCLVSVILLYVLFSHVDVGAVLAVLSDAKLKYLFAALCLLVVAQVVSSARWGLLARSVGFNNGFGEFVLFYWIGMFFNLFLPSIVGGDVSRTLYLAQSKKAEASSKLGWTGKAATSVLTDRAIGLITLVWMAAVTLLFYPISKMPDSVRYATFLLALVIPLAWFLLIFLSRFFRGWFYTLGDSVADALDTYRSKGRLAIVVLVLALVIHGLSSTMYLPIGWSLGIDLPKGYMFVTYATVALLSALPITFYGIGIRESALVLMLAEVEVPAETALAIGVLWFFTVLSLSLGGGVAFLIRKSYSEPRTLETESGLG